MKEYIKTLVSDWSSDCEVALPSWKEESLIARIEGLFNELRKGEGHHVEALPLSWDKSIEDDFNSRKANAHDDLQRQIMRVKAPHGWIYMLQDQLVFVPEFAEMQPEIHEEVNNKTAPSSIPGKTIKATDVAK